jgi:hypothetical protein
VSVDHVEVLVEEPSMEAALRIILPRLLNEISFEIYPFQCKEDLLKRLPERLRGYNRFMPENWRIVVVVDRDNNDCEELKAQLDSAAIDAGLITKSNSKRGFYSVINRIVIEELEAWYFGDWNAVRQVFPRVDANVPAKAGFRNPDEIVGGTWEAFERILQRYGYFKGGLRKIEVAKTIAKRMDPAVNTSRSFQIFRDAILELALLE